MGVFVIKLSQHRGPHVSVDPATYNTIGTGSLNYLGMFRFCTGTDKAWLAPGQHVYKSRRNLYYICRLVLLPTCIVRIRHTP